MPIFPINSNHPDYSGVLIPSESRKGGSAPGTIWDHGMGPGSIQMRLPDLPTSAAGRGFTITGLTVLPDGRFFAADGIGKVDQDAVGPIRSALVQLLRVGDGLQLVNYWNLADIMAGLEESAGVPVDPTVYSIQQLSYRPDVDRVVVTAVSTAASVCWCLLVIPGTGTRTGAIRAAFDTNGFEADRDAGNYIAVTTGPNARRRQYATLSSTGMGTPYAFAGGVSLDQADYESLNRLHLSAGANGVDGTIYTITTPADLSTATLAKTTTIPGVKAIEGIRSMGPSELLVCDDAYYHKVGTYNAIWAIRPNPLY